MFGCRSYTVTLQQLVRDTVENSLNNTEAKSTIIVVAHLMLYTVYFTGLYERETNLNFVYGFITHVIENVLHFKPLFSFTLFFYTFLRVEDCSVCDLETHAIFILYLHISVCCILI